MPTNPNQNETHSDETDNTPVPTPSAPESIEKQPSSAAAPESAPRVVPGSLNNAVMRTFRGDITKNQGANAHEAVQKFVPQVSPKDDPTQNSTTYTQNPKKRNEAVVHTFKDDVQDLVRHQKMSLTRVAALESDRGETNKAEPFDTQQWKTTMIVALAVLLLVIAAVLGAGAYYAYRLNAVPDQTQQLAPAIIFTEAREKFDVTDKSSRSITAQLANARRSTLFSLGSIVELYLTRTIEAPEGRSMQVHLTASEFLEAIDASVPEAFIQTLSSDYLVGLHVVDESIPFIVLTTTSYGHAFAGMLAWEQHIEENLSPFFSPNTQATKPAITENQNGFKDTIIENIDVRVLRDGTGTIRILYAFVDRKTIVITTNVRTLLEVAQRLRVQ